MSLRLFSRRKHGSDAKRGWDLTGKSPFAGHTRSSDAALAPYETPETDPLKLLVQQSRFQAILEKQEDYADHPHGAEIIRKATQELEHRMALVPTGTATIHQGLQAGNSNQEEEIDVSPFLLDIHCVTNDRFQKFVDAGGYDDLGYWPEEIWPHLIEFRDLTGQPGPRYWRQGRHPAHWSNHPVVGVSWYEAQAFALWIHQRLPTEAEWQMAASWHIKSTMDVMRRFPWGDAMDVVRCNIWSSRIGATVPVDTYPNGAAPNQILQLVGNVWEWTDTEYNLVDEQGRPIVGEMPMHVIRGGAFDTYFEAQTTSHFRTGQIALARTHNAGFRCAMDLSNATWINEG